MSEIKAKDMNYKASGPGRTLQQVFDGDGIGPPEPFRQTPEMELGTADVSIDRYISKDWHNREVREVWQKTWQVACRVEEIPEIGDYIVYDIVDDSVIVIRTSETEIKAYFNACLHRGNALCLGSGNARRLRCPFHGFTWSIGGELHHIPSQWDFEHVEKENFSLPEARLSEWGGFVFINLDPECETLEEYLEILPQHLAPFNFENRYIAVHVSMVVGCNWKVAQEAFIEGYHVSETHYDKDEFGNLL